MRGSRRNNSGGLGAGLGAFFAVAFLAYLLGGGSEIAVIVGSILAFPAMIATWLFMAERGAASSPTMPPPTPYRPRRPPIPKVVKQAVFDRDGGRCVDCGSNEKIHFDHIIPFSKGGADTEENLQILCQTCNLRKGPNL